MRTADRERRNATRIRRGPPRPTPDRAHLGELQQPPRAELASVAAALHPAERQPRIEDDDGVHEDHPGVDPRGDRPAAIVVGGPHGRAQAVVGVVGQRDRGGLVGHAGDHRDRAERLLAEHAHRAVRAGEDDRVDPRALAEPAGVLPGARGDGLLDLRAQRLGKARLGERPDLGGRVGGVADAQRGRLLDDRLLEGVGDGLDRDEALGVDAGLAGVCEPRRDRPAAACSMSASSSTTKGSEPPSSRTDVFSSRPAIAATLDPARSEPVSVTPRTRGSASICSTPSTSLSTVWNVPSGKPVSANSSAMRSAQPGTLGACLRSTTLPATSIAGAKRKTCT
jgi:hypothetical protein